MDILDILLDILLEPPQPLMGLFLNLMNHNCERRKDEDHTAEELR